MRELIFEAVEEAGPRPAEWLLPGGGVRHRCYRLVRRCTWTASGARGGVTAARDGAVPLRVGVAACAWGAWGTWGVVAAAANAGCRCRRRALAMIGRALGHGVARARARPACRTPPRVVDRAVHDARAQVADGNAMLRGGQLEVGRGDAPCQWAFSDGLQEPEPPMADARVDHLHVRLPLIVREGEGACRGGHVHVGCGGRRGDEGRRQHRTRARAQRGADRGTRPIGGQEGSRWHQATRWGAERCAERATRLSETLAMQLVVEGQGGRVGLRAARHVTEQRAHTLVSQRVRLEHCVDTRTQKPPRCTFEGRRGA